MRLSYTAYTLLSRGNLVVVAKKSANKKDKRFKMTDSINYEFKMVQLPQTFVLKQDTGKEIAAYLEKLVQETGAQGWEFYRIDQVGVLVQPGCLAAFTGTKQTMTYYNVITFRRSKVV
jgi:hypothetical protein